MRAVAADGVAAHVARAVAAYNLRAVVVLAAFGVMAVAAGVASLTVTVIDYVASTQLVTTAPGNVVVRSTGELAAFHRYQAGIEPDFIGLGLVAVVASVLIAAALWRPRGLAKSASPQASRPG